MDRRGIGPGAAGSGAAGAQSESYNGGVAPEAATDASPPTSVQATTDEPAAGRQVPGNHAPAQPNNRLRSTIVGVSERNERHADRWRPRTYSDHGNR